MLYHYTSLEKLKNILKTQQLWFTKISDFDDISEFNHTFSLISKELSLPFNDLLHEVTKINDNIFISSFCDDFDKPYLWNNYGEFNIGFSKTALNSMVHYQQRAFGYITANSNFLRCKYCIDGQEAFIRSAFKQCNKEKGYTIPVIPLAHLATIFKKSEFCPEQETRLVLYLKDGSPIKTLESGNKKINYFILPFRTDDESQPIKSITVGPNICFDSVERELRTCIDEQNFGNIVINRSEISCKEFSNYQPFDQTKECEKCERTGIS